MTLDSSPRPLRTFSAQQKYNLIEPILSHHRSVQDTALQGGIARRTIQRWLQLFRQHGWDGLKTKTRTDRHKTRPSNRDWQTMTRALALTRPAYQITDILEWIEKQAAQRNIQPPTYQTVRRWYGQIDAGLLTMATKGTQAYRHERELVYRWETQQPNALWQADHTLLDIQVLHETGGTVRPWLTLIEDDHSRAVCGFVLSTDHPNALQTALALRHAIYPKNREAWPVCGLPQRLYTDRGQDFLSHHLEEICLRLHIQVVRSLPRQPRGKGKIERLFQTLNTGLLRTLPGYTKTPPGDRNMKSLLTMSQLDGYIETFITQTYLTRTHRTTRQTPLARWQAGGFVPQLPTDWSLLDELLLTVSNPRKVQRDGIHFRGLRYLSTTLAAYVGEVVTIRYDPRDLAEIRVYQKDAFIGRALCQSLTHQTVSLKELDSARRKVRQQRKAQLAQATDFLKALEPPGGPESPLPPPPAPQTTESTPESNLFKSSPAPLKLYTYGHRG